MATGNNKGVTPADYKDSAPLWGQVAQWREANQTMAYLVRRHENRLQYAKTIARTLINHLRAVFLQLDSLCVKTCPWCPEPCCMVAKVWIDFKDLVFLHLAGCDIPPTQLIKDMSGRCRYLGSRGCTLDRLIRPWVCTWYICGTQTRILNDQEKQAKQVIDKAFSEIKRLRHDMEAAFIDVII
jgi:hypothetical protein